MEHNIAIETRAAERYVLGDMNEADASEFETHFFDCGECARNVRDTAAFADNARVVFDEDERKAEIARQAAARRRFGWRKAAIALPYAATVFLGSILGYQTLVTIPELIGLTAPRVVKPTVLRAVRADPTVVEIGAGEQTFILVIDVNSPESYDGYVLDFDDASATNVQSVNAEPPQDPQEPTLIVSLPSADFPSGRYTMTLGGTAGSLTETLEKCPFIVNNLNDR